MIDLFVQAVIAILGGAAIALLSSKNVRVRWWGFMCGLVSEPFWIYAALAADPVQWGIFLLALWWAFFYYRGVRNSWP